MATSLLIVARLGLASLIGFEGLNWFGVLDFTLDFSWLGLMVTAVAVLALLEGSAFLLKRTTGRGLHPVAYFAGAVALAVDAIGDIVHLYGRFAWYDQAAHFLGGAVVGIVAFNVLWQLEGVGRIRIGAGWRSLFIVSMGALFGSLYEIEEYLEDLWKWHRQVRLGDGPDTVNDIIFNILGALAVAIIAAFIVRKRHVDRSSRVEPKNPATP
ncbi:hypothetical protein HYW67_00845 [Candidatus Parcubacteria bacterium]|nr:hypothetical protein [Candidatus Parcubacteria bacterium]